MQNFMKMRKIKTYDLDKISNLFWFIKFYQNDYWLIKIQVNETKWDRAK
jgi:hypothetical protein